MQLDRPVYIGFTSKTFAAFAAAIRAQERERCAAVADEVGWPSIAAAIRGMGDLAAIDAALKGE